MGEFEVSSDWLGEEMTLTITASDACSPELPNGVLLEGMGRERVSLPSKALLIVVDQREGPVRRQFVVMRDLLPEAVIKVQEQLQVS